ncbi:hypothetical protein [Vibrio cortegadensis]|uniref:hypothetical protein n=1 Tax=Vibrio cortegadensis TaxID=1328770 RepID=UPI00352F67ED
MHTRTRLFTFTTLIFLSVLGGLIAHYFEPDMGFIVGILASYLMLSVFFGGCRKSEIITLKAVNRTSDVNNSGFLA